MGLRITRNQNGYMVAVLRQGRERKRGEYEGRVRQREKGDILEQDKSEYNRRRQG